MMVVEIVRAAWAKAFLVAASSPAVVSKARLGLSGQTDGAPPLSAAMAPMTCGSGW